MKHKLFFAMAAGIATCAACANQQNASITPLQSSVQRGGNASAHRGTSPAQRLIVANSGAQGIVSFNLPASDGNIVPYQNVNGSNSDLLGVRAVAVAPGGGIYANQIWGLPLCIGSMRYNLVPEFTANANGNVAPFRTVDATPYEPMGVALDASSDLWIAGCGSSSAVLEYAPGASGKAKPTKTIAGDKTGLVNPTSISLDSSGNIYVSNALSASTSDILEFSSTANGNVAPVADIEGSNTQLGQVRQISIDSSIYGPSILVAELDPNMVGKVLAFGLGGSGNVGPFAAITSVDSPAGVVSDQSSGNIWVSAYSTNAIKEFAPNANGNATPIFSIHGSNTQVSAPANLALRNL